MSDQSHTTPKTFAEAESLRLEKEREQSAELGVLQASQVAAKPQPIPHDQEWWDDFTRRSREIADWDD